MWNWRKRASTKFRCQGPDRTFWLSCKYFPTNWQQHTFQSYPELYKGDPRTCTTLTQHGAQIGGLWVFPQSNNRSSSDVYVTCIYCGLSVKIKHEKCSTRRKDCEHIGFAFVFVCLVGKTQRTTIWAPCMADDAITQCSIRVLGSPLYICDPT